MYKCFVTLPNNINQQIKSVNAELLGFCSLFYMYFALKKPVMIFFI